MTDSDCDPPATVCGEAGMCVAGCPLDPTRPGCPLEPQDLGFQCNTDQECIGWPANICSGGACVPGCSSTGCPAGQICSSTSGHCGAPSCARDMDCDPGSYCTPAASCAVLAFGGAIPCAGGTAVSYQCAMETTANGFITCVGAPGPNGCPYCIDRSCLHPGVCSTANDCHRGDACMGAQGGLCLVQSPQCPPEAIVPLSDVVSGKYAAGKELCVHDVVTQSRTGFDGMLEFRLASSPYLYFDISPMYQAAGVHVPNVGDTVTVHGTVRWDQGHNDRELLPVDWVGP
jgi:hypothetical protein